MREVAGQRLTHPDRLLWPREGGDAGVTKADLAAYWQAMSARALPEIADRPLAMVRCPDGIEGEHFFQKHKTRGMPDALREGVQDGAPYLALSDLAGLIAAAQIAAIELHGWGSPGSDPAHADRLVFDLDPDEGLPFARTVEAALEVRRRLKEAEGLPATLAPAAARGCMWWRRSAPAWTGTRCAPGAVASPRAWSATRRSSMCRARARPGAPDVS